LILTVLLMFFTTLIYVTIVIELVILEIVIWVWMLTHIFLFKDLVDLECGDSFDSCEARHGNENDLTE